MGPVTQIKVGKHNTGIVGLDHVMKDMAELRPKISDTDIAVEMIKRLSKKNYIPAGAREEYKKAFIREYRKLRGRPVSEEPLEHVEVKVLGAGCPICDKLEMALMKLIEEMGSWQTWNMSGI